MYIEAKDGRTPANTIKVFGWILSIEEIASANEAVRIVWTPDYWRTYSGSAVFGKGIITRCNNATYKRPYAKSPRRWKISRIEKFANTNPWCCVVYNKTTGTSPVITTIERICWQLGVDEDYGGYTYHGLTITEVMQGRVDEAFGIAPTTITGIFITPFQPHAGQIHRDSPGSMGRVWYWSGYGSATSINTETPGTELITDDMHEAVVVDPYGCIVGRVPYGCKINKMTYYSDIGTNDLKTMACLDDMNDATAGNQAGALGRVISIPALTAPVNSNAYSEYAFSGQREYDMKYAELQRNEERLKGYINSGTNLLGGAIAGGMAGGPAGAVAGVVAGTVMTIAGNEINYDIQGKLNDKYQKMTDDLYANQSPNLLVSGGGMAYTNMIGQWAWIQLEADSVSMAEYTADVTNNGYETQIPVGNPNSFISAGGPLQIDNLMITGPIPPEAKTYIKNILSNGVRIVENNPTGVVP